jgi:hypothetical protein
MIPGARYYFAQKPVDSFAQRCQDARGQKGEHEMTNSQNREWLESALRHWQQIKPSRRTPASLIAWNIKWLELWLKDAPQ